MVRTEVLVIGGGMTGLGTARDLAMRGFEVLLVEGGDFCSGTSGRNHGMLHSGGRYVVSDPTAASECAMEARVLRGVASEAIDDCGGVFVDVGDDPGYAGTFPDACRKAGVRSRELSVREARDLEPCLSGDIVTAHEVDDASVDPFRLAMLNVRSAREAGATLRNHCRVESMHGDDRVEEVALRDARSGRSTVRPEFVINASGPWCSAVASLASADIPVSMSRGTLVVLEGRITNGLVNRLRPPSDGDIVVPSHGTAVLGTTAKGVEDPCDDVPTRDEVVSMMRDASRMVPAISSSRPIRAFAGVRPLMSGTGRSASRGFAVLRHDRMDNVISLVGGKLTTYRLMAERAADAVAETLGRGAACRTHIEAMHNPSPSREGPMVCTCESVTRGEVEALVRSGDVLSLADVVRRTRAGMGYCQAMDCAYRVMAIVGDLDPSSFDERSKGAAAVDIGAQRPQLALRRMLDAVEGRP